MLGGARTLRRGASISMVQPVPSRGGGAPSAAPSQSSLKTEVLQTSVGLGPEDALDLRAGQLVVEMQARRAR